GYTIYRTHYGPASDKQWEILLDSLQRQTKLAMGSYVDEDWTEEDSHILPEFQCKSQEEYRRDVKQLQDLFYLDTCEDPSFDRLSVHQIRQVCVNNPPGNKKTMASYHFRYVLLANKAVFQAIEKGDY
ncbi:hypothetical protein IWW34DRAFT_911753, partial [Fusarium oxysporum f. sp. albedinis]